MLTVHSWGLAGVIGGIVVGTVFFAHIVAGTAGWIGLILFVAGVIFIIVETHVMPTHGLLLLTGTILAAVGLFYALGGDQHNALFPASTSLLLVVVVLVSFLFYLPKSRIWKIIGLPGKQRATAGYVSSADYRNYLGASGVTVSALRPSGVANFDGERLDVLTEGDFLDPNVPIEIFRIEGSKLVVRAISAAVNE
jgi:membrane-bound serine protease (ClpP class)